MLKDGKEPDKRRPRPIFNHRRASKMKQGLSEKKDGKKGMKAPRKITEIEDMGKEPKVLKKTVYH
jgi:hypothetical protein